jgi:hypothetical protein
MAERVAEIVDPDICEVTTDGKTVRLANRAGGKWITIALPFVLRQPLPSDQRLQAAFAALAKGVQRAMSSCGQSSWPRPGAQPHVSVTDEAIEVWWAGPDQADGSARLRSFDRREFGL